jgi:hypothetical protein
MGGFFNQAYTAKNTNIIYVIVTQIRKFIVQYKEVNKKKIWLKDLKLYNLLFKPL